MKNLEELKRILATGAMENIIGCFYNDFVETNATARAEAGMKQIIIREAIGGCCAWCSAMVGEWEYGSHPTDIFRRHDNCTCVVTFRDESGYTDVWSKKNFSAHRNARVEKFRQIEADDLLTAKTKKKRRIEKDKNGKK